jgi:outer membrane protein assembly factor BamD (BamD/ComL family)
VQQARLALVDNPARALELADHADDRFPSGALVQEREVVAIEALVQLGRQDDARERAGRFLRRFPASVYQRHLEALLGFDTGVHGP